MEQTAALKIDYYDMEFKAFTETSLDIFRRLKHVYRADSAGFETLFTKSINTGNKRYTMDIKKIKKDLLCLTITETNKNIGSESRRVNVFDSAAETASYKQEVVMAV